MKLAEQKEFAARVARIEAQPGYRRPLAFSLGIRRKRGEKTLDVLYPLLNYQSGFDFAAVVQELVEFPRENAFVPLSAEELRSLGKSFSAFVATAEQFPNVAMLREMMVLPRERECYAEVDIGIYFLFASEQKVASAEEAYFKLQLLSQRYVTPHSLCLDGIFAALTTVAWTSHGPYLPEDVAAERLKYWASARPLEVGHVDKFPYLLNYHVPEGVRIASGSQVRLGAYLGEGTTVMPSGFVNFNAGTLGSAMVEGRVSAGVVVGKESDIGGGASIMGTLSGGNQEVIAIGEKTLLGANAGTGISLGNGCTIAAGLYVYAGMKVSLYNEKNEAINLAGAVVAEGRNVVKARELSGRDYLLFICDSQTGRVICRPNRKAIELNAELHRNG